MIKVERKENGLKIDVKGNRNEIAIELCMLLLDLRREETIGKKLVDRVIETVIKEEEEKK